MSIPGPVDPKERRDKPRGRFGYSEDTDEAPRLLAEEPTDIEGNAPSEDRPSVESAGAPPVVDSAAFEE
jgi:hypothetical protein